LYEGDVSVAGTADPYDTAPLSIEVREDGNTQTVNCELLVRRANYILLDVDVHPIAAAPGDAVTINVKTLDFEYGVQYQLQVEGGTGTMGNFQALDFSALDHSACGYPEFGTGGQSGGADYRANIVDNDLVVHINDYVTTKPGNMVGPTNQGIRDRVSGYPNVSVSQWEGMGRPHTPQLCCVPICERTEDPNGRTVYRIVSFATFFLENQPNGNEPVMGTFIEWTSPGVIVTPYPPGPLAVQAAHLTSNRLDF
jgi:hypothetical protein